MATPKQRRDSESEKDKDHNNSAVETHQFHKIRHPTMKNCVRDGWRQTKFLYFLNYSNF